MVYIGTQLCISCGYTYTLDIPRKYIFLTQLYMHMLRLYLYVGNVVLSYYFRGGKETYFKYMLLMLKTCQRLRRTKLVLKSHLLVFFFTHSHDTGFRTNINGVGD